MFFRLSDQKFFGISETGFFEKTRFLQEFDTRKYMLGYLHVHVSGKKTVLYTVTVW